MSRLALKGIQAAAGAAGGDPVYVDDVFSTYVYTSNGAGRNIVNGIDLDGEGGLVWSKIRAGTTGSHCLIDTERGVTKNLHTNATSAETTEAGSVTAFNSDGYTIGTNGLVNYSTGYDFASWTFRKQPGFFDVVTWTGDGTNNRAISHNLGSTPGMVIIKRTDSSSPWTVIHRSLSSITNHSIYLDESSGQGTGNVLNGWSSTSFTIGTYNNVYYNGSGGTYVAYLFAHDAQDFGTNSDESIIKCGSYTGNGNTSTGQEINLGFEPQFVMIKASSSSGDWFMLDTMRGFPVSTNSADDPSLLANSSAAEASYQIGNPTSTGFKVHGNSGDNNGSGITYIYMAIRRPHKPAEEFAATDLFATDFAESSGIFTGEAGFPVDFVIYTDTNGANNYAYSRLTGPGYLTTDTSNAETGTGGLWDSMTNFRFNGSGNYSTWLNWLFRRAPGFFDVVVYTGDGSSSQTLSHNLDVAPEFIITKNRDDGGSLDRWWSYSSAISGSNQGFALNEDTAVTDVSNLFPSAPTADNMYVGSISNYSNESYIAYLFATAPGISKVGTYTGTGSAQTIDCGFSNGARFVLIKQTNSTGDWRLFDTERGIIVGNDPMLALNNTTASTAYDDYLVPESSGFRLVGNPSNSSGDEFIFLAIA